MSGCGDPESSDASAREKRWGVGFLYTQGGEGGEKPIKDGREMEKRRGV